MAFLIDEAFLPATLTVPSMTDAEFAEFVAEHPDLSFEMTAEGKLIVMPPTFSLTEARNGEIAAQLKSWASVDGKGISGGSSGGFVLPNGARRSPDAWWVPRTTIENMSDEAVENYWHLCPAFIVELRSDRPRVLREKMREWIDNGAQLAWMIDPQTHTVEIYRPGREPELLTSPASISGEGPVNGFILDLQRVWNPIATGLS